MTSLVSVDYSWISECNEYIINCRLCCKYLFRERRTVALQSRSQAWPSGQWGRSSHPIAAGWMILWRDITLQTVRWKIGSQSKSWNKRH